MELSELIESVDILEYISQYADFTEKNGEYWGLSPLKEERTPSFSIRREEGRFYDFSSGIGGNVLTFVRYYHKCGYAEAVQILRDYAGVQGYVAPRKKLLVTEIAKRFSAPKPSSKGKSGKNAALPENYQTRYEKKPEKLAVWEAEGISRTSLDRFQVYYDGFSNRLVYPIRSADGSIVNVGGRTLDPDWKEKGQRKYTYFKGWNGGMDIIYGLAENMEQILEQREIILFEGCKSVLLADTWGFSNGGALLTSHLSLSQMKMLSKLGCRVVFALDKDVNIRNDYNIRKLKQFVNVEFIFDRENLLGEKDAPVDRGFEVWKRLYEGRIPYH